MGGKGASLCLVTIGRPDGAAIDRPVGEASAHLPREVGRVNASPLPVERPSRTPNHGGSGAPGDPGPRTDSPIGEEPGSHPPVGEISRPSRRNRLSDPVGPDDWVLQQHKLYALLSL